MPEAIVNVTTTGSAGSAIGNTDTPGPIPQDALIHAVYLDHHASAPGTQSVTIQEVQEDGSPGKRKVIDAKVGNTDVQYGTGDFADGKPFVSSGRKLNVDVTISNALTNAVIATIYYIER